MKCIKEENAMEPWNDFSAGRTNNMADNVIVSLHSIIILTHNKSYGIFLTETECKNEGQNECNRYVSANSPFPPFWEKIYR